LNHPPARTLATLRPPAYLKPVMSIPIFSRGRRSAARHSAGVIASLALLSSALSACTAMRWDRPDTDAATYEADRRECRASSRAQYRRLTERPFLVPYFVTARDNKGRIRNIPVVPWQQVGPPIWMPYAPGLAIDQTTLKYELFDDCLKAKGYQLVPEEEDGQAPS
jgi:hypothetical protein